MFYYELVSENLTALGGPMGTEHTWDNWRKSFSSIAKAKAYAEEDYKAPISWISERGSFRSPDLGYVMYHIRQVKVI